MRIITIFVQHKESYPGECAPELIAAVDEYTNDDNPIYLQEKIKETQQAISKGVWDFYKVLEFEIDDKEFDKQFYGTPIKVQSVKEV